MKLHTAYVRFYKSFNFDHLRKAHPDAKPKPWELIEGVWFPYVEVPIENQITTVVGANESGKSHLLSAVEKAISGQGFEQRDLCRYSPFFNVEKGRTFWPHLGVSWTEVSTQEAENVKSFLAIDLPPFDHFSMFRQGPGDLTLYIPGAEGTFSEHVIENETAASFGTKLLPATFRIKPDVALPNSIPLAWLIDPNEFNRSLTSRRLRATFLQGASVIKASWVGDPNQFAQHAPQLYARLKPYFDSTKAILEDDDDLSSQSLALARDLLVELANVDPARLRDLSDAISNGHDGHANALVSRINDQLAKHLNFPKWWAQDRDFALKVTPREFDLVFTVQDRTGTEYTFKERSSGLKYFLSYLIQSQAHRPSDDRNELLLMDEPDAYLSAEAQQDLLKIFEDFAEPKSGKPPVQVIYVTHSPFLIDKNHAERIRVLQKGKGYDGTRVVKNASQNHYEPLRSAFGAFVGETAFVGACNLLVEGVADQILLAGIARLTRQSSLSEGDTLDLNRLVIVPCASATQIPYMLHLIRGRDTDKPPVIILLDSDGEAAAVAMMLRGNDHKIRRLVNKDYILQIGEIASIEDSSTQITEIEDLIPLPLAVQAANKYLTEVGLFREAAPTALDLDDVTVHTQAGKNTFDALNLAAQQKNAHLEKIGFARATISLCSEGQATISGDVRVFLDRMRAVFRCLNKARRRAERENLRDKVGTLVDRQQAIFFRDNPSQATKESALNLLEQIETVLDDSLESDAVKVAIVGLKREFKLDEELGTRVADFDLFRQKVSMLKNALEIGQLAKN